MKKHESAAAATYTPQTFKSFAGALYAFFKEECPQIGGDRTRRMLVRCIDDMVRKFFPETSHLRPGQTIWPTVSKDARPGYGRRILDTELIPVLLTLVQSRDAADRAKGKKLREMKIEAVARLFLESYRQGAVLTIAEVALLLKISASTVSRYVAEWEAAHGQVLPRRGTIHDMGPTLSHKRIIIRKLFIEQKSVQQTARETYHSLPAVQRYISAFRQVLLCRQKGMNTHEIAYATRKSVRLVKQYERIIDEYAHNSEVLKRLLHFQPRIENSIEQWALEHGSRT